MNKSDEELVAEYLAGEHQAFTDLTRRHLSGVYSFALRFVGDGAQAEDIAQETFVKAWTNLAKYRRQSSKFKTWLLHIARNTAIDSLRKRKDVPFSYFETETGNSLVETLPDSEVLPEQLFATNEDRERVIQTLDELTLRHREILLLYYTSDLTFQQISEIEGASINTIKSRHRRALIALKTVLMSKE